jgi:hypothetical protein
MEGRFSFAGAGCPVKATPLNGLAAREPEGRPCGGAFLSPISLREQRNRVARHNEHLYEAGTVGGRAKRGPRWWFEPPRTALEGFVSPALPER